MTIRGLLVSVAILAGWALLGLAVGIADHRFAPWRVPMAYYVVVLPPLAQDYYRVAGPFVADASGDCARRAKRLGVDAECAYLPRARGDALLTIDPSRLSELEKVRAEFR